MTPIVAYILLHIFVTQDEMIMDFDNFILTLSCKSFTIPVQVPFSSCDPHNPSLGKTIVYLGT